MLAILGIILGLGGFVFLFALPGLGIIMLIVALLLFAAQGNANKRAKEENQRAIEERRHQEILAATRNQQPK